MRLAWKFGEIEMCRKKRCSLELEQSMPRISSDLRGQIEERERILMRGTSWSADVLCAVKELIRCSMIDISRKHKKE